MKAGRFRAHSFLRFSAFLLRNMSTQQKSESEWRAVLSPAQFRILREKGTEPAGSGEYNHHKAQGLTSSYYLFI